MELSHRFENDICVINIVGGISLQTRELKTYLEPFLKDSQLKGLVINLEEVPFIGSTTVGIFLEAHQTLQNHRIPFVLCQLNEVNQKVLKFTQINTIIDIYSTEKEALASITDKTTPKE